MLTARPRRLEAVSAELPELKGKLPDTPLGIAEQRERLLAIPADKVERYRINPRALDQILPALATLRRDKPLRNRVIALSAAQADQMAWSTIARLVPWIYEADVFRKRVHSRARREPPQSPLPRWLVVYWREALGREAPAERLATAARAEEPVLARLLPALQLPPGSPLAREVLRLALADRDGAWLDTQPHTETLRFIEGSGAPVGPRIELLRRILARYGGLVRTPGDLQAPTEELFMVARHLLQGWPGARPGLWRSVPASALRAARWCERLESLRDGFGTDDPRVGAWRRWLRHIQRVDTVGDGIVGVQVGVKIFAEPRENARVCRVYPPVVWQDFCARQAASDTPLAPPKPEVKLAIADDRSPIDAYIAERVGLRP